MHFLSLWTALSICGPLTAEYISWVDDVRPASGRSLVQVQVQSKAEMMAGAVRAYYSHLGPRHSEEQTTSWKAYRYFPSMPPQPPVKFASQGFIPNCAARETTVLLVGFPRVDLARTLVVNIHRWSPETSPLYRDMTDMPAIRPIMTPL